MNSSVLSPAPSPETASKKGEWNCLYTDLLLITMSSLSPGCQVGRDAKLGLVSVNTTGFPSGFSISFV